MSKNGYSYDIENYTPDLRQFARSSNGYVLEIGIGKGDGSTLAFQDGLEDHPNPLHISVDIQNYLEIVPSVPWWHLVLQNSTHVSTMEYVRTISPRTPGVIFIDTHHTRDHIKAELAVWEPIAGPETIWLFHDTYMTGPKNDMTIEIEEFAANSNGKWVYDDYSTEPHGLGRMRYGRT